MLSQKAKYALRALIALADAKPGDAVLISEISERQKIPRKFLEQILLDLKHHGIVHSKRGKHGGYGLLKPPAEIYFGPVVRIIDGPIAPLPCLSKTAYRRCEDCSGEDTCVLRRVFAVTHEATTQVLDNTSLADAIDNNLEGMRDKLHTS